MYTIMAMFEQPQTGSAGAPVPGMGDALQQAIQARSQATPVPQLSQVSPGAPSAQGAVPTQAPTVSQTANLPSPQESTGSAQPNSEAELIIKALSQRMKAISDVEKAQTQPTGAPAMNMGGGGYMATGLHSAKSRYM